MSSPPFGEASLKKTFFRALMVAAVIHGTEFRLVSDALACRSHRRPDTPGVPGRRFLFLLRPRWEADPRPDPTLLSQQEAQTRTTACSRQSRKMLESALMGPSWLLLVGVQQTPNPVCPTDPLLPTSPTGGGNLLLSLFRAGNALMGFAPA